MSFETRFFGGGNRLKWDAIQTHSLPADVERRLGPFLEDIRKELPVLVLPCVREDGRVQWYVLCRTPRAMRVARDEVRAFLGLNYSDFEGRSTVLDSNDPVDLAVLESYGANAFRFEVPNREIFDLARERLRLMIQLRIEKPVRYAQRSRTAGRVLRDFEYSLLVSDDRTASQCIEELRAAGQLNATNLLFLEVRRLAATLNWDAILALPELDLLVNVTRPRRVTEALVRAVYSSRLREFEQGNRAKEAVSRFRDEIFDRFRDLYRTRANIHGYEVDVSFLLVAAISGSMESDIAETTLARYPAGSEIHSYIADLARLIRPASKKSLSPIDAARNAFTEADIDQAFELSLALPPSFERCALLLRCAREMGTLSAAQSALSAVATLDGADADRLNENLVLSRIYVSLAELSATELKPNQEGVAEEIPDDWSSWLKRLGAARQWKTALAVAEVGAREWDTETLLQDPGAVQDVADLILSERPDWGQNSFRDAVPFLLEFVLSSGPDPRLKPIYENLFLALALDEQVSLLQLTALIRLAQVRLRLGVPTPDYLEIIQQLGAAIERIESPSVADAALDSLEVLVNEACPDPDARQQFANRIANVFHRWYRRIDSVQFALLQSYSEDLGTGYATTAAIAAKSTAPDEIDEWVALRGKKIAVYSLQEPAMRRAASVIDRLCPEARIDTFHDEVGGSPALRMAAAAADIFILVTGAAKHSATTFIEARRPKQLVTLYARGQGSSSILSSLREYLATLQ